MERTGDADRRTRLGCGTKLAAILSVALAVTTLGGVMAPHARVSAAQLRVGALFLDAQGFYGGIAKGIKQGAASSNVSLLSSNSGGDAAKEASFMATLIASKVDAIIMSPVSTQGSIPVVKRAAQAGIPVICYNTCLTDQATKQYVKGFVATDQKGFGAAVGADAAAYFRRHGLAHPKIGILNCDVYEACQLRKQGFKQALSAGVPGAAYVVDQSGFIVDKATQVGTQILTAHPDLNALYATAEGGTIGAVKAVQAHNLAGKTVVFGSDIDNQIAQFLLGNGNILVATDAQNPQLMGRLAMQLALKAAGRRTTSSSTTLVPSRVYTSSAPRDVRTWLAAHKDGLP